METICKQTFDEERALYGSRGVVLQDCAFDGLADGESALKESANVRAERCFFNLRYPLWHDEDVEMRDCEMTPLCRAALWYSRRVEIDGSRLHGIKAVRECDEVRMRNCDVDSAEFGWFTRGLQMTDCAVKSEYCALRARNLRFENVRMEGKYSFQYIEDAVFENCTFDTKDAFWHAKNVVVRNSVVKGEYLAWYSENVTFENCKIIGTQPLCYCKGLKLVECEMVDTDLAFERSAVEATITTPVISIKNPLRGHIRVPKVGEIIRDIPEAKGEILISGRRAACA